MNISNASAKSNKMASVASGRLQWKLLLVWLTVSRLGDIHWRLIAGDTQQLALMWIEGHKPLLFPILYHILKFISVSLGKDLSKMRQSSVNSLVCDGSIR